MRVLKESFNAGEFTERLHSRYEIAKYKNACKTLTNFVPLPHGPVTRRPGTEYIAEVKDSQNTTNLIPFEFSVQDSYIIEAGDLYFRFFKNGGELAAPDAATVLLLHFNGEKASTSILDASLTPHTMTATYASLKTSIKKFGSSSLYNKGTGSFVSCPDSADFDFDSGTFTIDFWVYFEDVSSSKGFFQQDADSSNFVSFSWDASGTPAIEFYSKLAGVVQHDMSFAWSPSINTWYHVALIRGWASGADSWAVTIDGTQIGTTQTDATDYPNIAAVFEIGKAYDSTHATLRYHLGMFDEFRASKASARWTANFQPPSSEYPAGDSSYGSVYEITTTYTANDVQNLYFTQSADVMYFVNENYVVRILTRSADVTWGIADVSFTTAPSAWSVGDYPRTIVFYEDRLYFGGSPDQPDTIWASDVGDYAVFTAGGADDAAITLTLAARKINDIRWMGSGRKLIIGTNGEEWWASGSSDTEPMTPTAQVAKRDSSWGSSRVMPIEIGDTIFYIQRNGRIVRELKYEYSQDAYISTDLSILGEHLTRDYEIIDMAYQQRPYQVLWCVRDDGTLLSLSYLKEHEVVGWAKHTSGSGEFESVAVISGATEDEVWFIVKRVVDGSDVKYIERLKPFNYGDLDDAFFVDSGLSYDGPAATTISGLDHLEGEAVDVLADGLVVTGKTVTSGTITLATAASKVHVGLPYDSELETLDLVSQDDKGTLQGVIGRVTNVAIRLINSLGGIFGPSSSTTDAIPYDDSTTEFTGWTRDLTFDEGYDETKTVYIKCNEPLPFEVAAILFDLED